MDNLTQETIFADGQPYFERLINDINNAQSSIELEVYIFQNSTLGDHVIQALCHAAQRGVHVRVLVDGAGSPLWGATYANALELNHAFIIHFHGNCGTTVAPSLSCHSYSNGSTYC